MSQTGLIYHHDYLKHDTGPGHPERPARLKAILEGLKQSSLHSQLCHLKSRMASLEAVARHHDRGYIDHVRQVCLRGPGLLDSADTVVSSESFRTALLAAGGVMAAVDAVLAGHVNNAFCAIRPPGHHAERSQAMGFCLFNNVAIAARYVQQDHHLARVLIVDWDVHHGNGTQHAFQEDPEVFYFSIHQYPHYPGTGSREERGQGRGEGTTLNAPMPAGSGDEDYRGVFQEQLLPEALRFNPDFVFISAGFDAHGQDPLSAIQLSDQAYEDMTRTVMEIAQRCCQGRLVSLLEGGYSLPALARCTQRHIAALMGVGG